MSDQLNKNLAAAEALFSAGNISRAKEFAQDILHKQDDHVGAFNCLFDIYMAQDDYASAIKLCKWRLMRCPECPDANLSHLIAFAHVEQEDISYAWSYNPKAEALMGNIRTRLRNHPYHLARTEIIYSYYFGETTETLALIENARNTGYVSRVWLDDVETNVSRRSGKILKSRKMLQEALAENPEDYDTVFSLSLTNYYAGFLFSSVKQAQIAKRLAPELSGLSQEIKIASLIGLCPLFWPAQIFITLSAFISGRFNTDLEGPVKLGIFYVSVLFCGFIVTRLMDMTSSLRVPLLIILGLNVVWSMYVLFSFLEIGNFWVKRKKSIKLSKKY